MEIHWEEEFLQLDCRRTETIWRDGNKRARGTLGVSQEVESLVHAVEVGGGVSTSAVLLGCQGICRDHTGGQKGC